MKVARARLAPDEQAKADRWTETWGGISALNSNPLQFELRCSERIAVQEVPVPSNSQVPSGLISLHLHSLLSSPLCFGGWAQGK